MFSDAPSRAPWEDALANNLPVPCDMPIQPIIKEMYTSPEEFAQKVKKRKKDLVGEGEWEPLEAEGPRPKGEASWSLGDGECEPRVDMGWDYCTPTFGSNPIRMVHEIPSSRPRST